MSEKAELDVISVGRASVDLYGQQIGGRLEDMSSFAKYIGGCATNIACGTARLGLKSALFTRVGDDHFGRFIREELIRNGVDVTAVRTDTDRLTALAVLGVRDQHTFPLIFYREDCADMAMLPTDVDPAFIASAKSVVITGTHLSTENTRQTCRRIVDIAKSAGCKVVLDIDYRPVLWGLAGKAMGEDRFVANQEVTDQLARVLPDCDLVVGTDEEYHIAGGSEDTLQALMNVRQLTDAALVLKLGEDGCVVFDGDIPDDLSNGHKGEGFPIEVFNVLGAGDAFMSGFLKGWLGDLPWSECCRYGNAAGALVVSRHGCTPASPSWEELQYFLKTGVTRPDLRNDRKLEMIHKVTTRARHYDNLTVLAIDHRSQFVDMIEETGGSPEKVAAFKSLAFEVVDGIASGNGEFGLLLDGRFGMRALEKSAGKSYWIGRPVELPGSKPVEFEGDPEIGCTIATWPANQVVKMLVNYHPDDPADMCEKQERQVARAYDACMKTGHEFLLEIICGTSEATPVGDDTIARVLERFADLEIYPDWWKLEASTSEAAWAKTIEALETHQPWSRGIVLLGLSAPIDDLLASFRIAATYPQVIGFTVGRSIFDEAARGYLSGQLNDAEARDMLKASFSKLVEGWHASRQFALAGE